MCPQIPSGFTASSGNRATFKALQRGNRVAVDATWEREATQDDIKEATEFMAEAVQQNTGDGVCVTSVATQDPQRRKAIRESFLGIGNSN